MTMAHDALSILCNISETEYRETDWWNDIVTSLNGFNSEETDFADPLYMSRIIVFNDGSRCVVEHGEWEECPATDHYGIYHYNAEGEGSFRFEKETGKYVHNSVPVMTFALVSECREAIKNRLGDLGNDVPGIDDEIEMYFETDQAGSGLYVIRSL